MDDLTKRIEDIRNNLAACQRQVGKGAPPSRIVPEALSKEIDDALAAFAADQREWVTISRL